MDIQPVKISIRDLTSGYIDNAENGVTAFGGTLEVRPAYQREFVYKDAQRDAVVRTVRNSYPLNTMYWAARDDGTFEVMDGQQRTISIGQYVTGDFTVDGLGFHNLQDDEQAQILDYELDVYQCTGTDSEKLAWFRVINIAGEELTEQELRNAVYHGPWVTDAKKRFSKNGCAAHAIAKDYLAGEVIRQKWLETAIKWINNSDIEGYMAVQQHKPNANELWLYFQNVIAWVKATFPQHRKEMKAVQWGWLYNEFKDAELDPAKLEAQIAELMADEDVTKKRGIYIYVLNGQERNLSIRALSLIHI